MILDSFTLINSFGINFISILSRTSLQKCILSQQFVIVERNVLKVLILSADVLTFNVKIFNVQY